MSYCEKCSELEKEVEELKGSLSGVKQLFDCSLTQFNELMELKNQLQHRIDANEMALKASCQCAEEFKKQRDEAERACAEMRDKLLYIQGCYMALDHGEPLEDLLNAVKNSHVESSTCGQDYIRRDEAEKDKKRLENLNAKLLNALKCADNGYHGGPDGQKVIDDAIDAAMNKEKERA